MAAELESPMADDEAQEEAAQAAPDIPDMEDDEDGEPRPRRAIPMRLIIIVGVVLVLVGIGVGVYVSGMLDSLLGIEDQTTQDETVYVEGQIFYRLEDITVNLHTEGPRSQFLKIGLTVVLVNEIDVPAVEALQPRIRDMITSYLRELRPDELAGSENFHRLRQNLLMRVKLAVAPITVTNILFDTTLVQ